MSSDVQTSIQAGQPILDAPVTQAGGANADVQPQRSVYEVGGARRVIFSILFLLLLPFFASLGPMLFARISHGAWTGTIGLILIAIFFFVVMFFLLTELLFSVRTKVVFKDDAVRMTMPTSKGPTPFFNYKTYEIPYADVAKVECHRELYGGRLAPIILKGMRVITKDGTTIPLGFVSEANVDPSLPFPEIAGQIADRAGLEIADCGCTRRKFRSRVLGLAPNVGDEIPIEDFDIERLNRQHYWAVSALVLGLAGLVAVGVFMDLVNPGGL